GELLEVLLDVYGTVLGAQRPQDSGNDGGVVPVPSVVIGLGEQADVGDDRGDRASRDPFVDEQVRLDRADAGHLSPPGGRRDAEAAGADSACELPGFPCWVGACDTPSLWTGLRGCCLQAGHAAPD